MATPEQIAAARARLVERWDAQGECGSCGFHGALSEHFVDDSDLEYALDHDGGVLRMLCLSDEAEEGGHRGVRIGVG